MQKCIPTGQIFELSNERQITGRRKIKVVLHEIFSNHNDCLLYTSDAADE